MIWSSKIFLMLLSLSNIVLASNQDWNCKVTVKEIQTYNSNSYYIYSGSLNADRTENGRRSNEKHFVQNWQECYEKAIDLAQAFDFKIDRTTYPTGLHYRGVNWTFTRKGFTNNTSGSVTKYTEQYSSSPFPGNQKFVENGEMLKYPEE